MAAQPAVVRVNGAHADIDRREAPASRTSAPWARPAAIPSARSAAAAGKAPAAQDTPALTPVKLSIIAGDPITGQGAVAYLRTRQEVDLLTAERQREAEVVLILVSRVTEETVAWMQHAAKSADGEVRFVLVGDGVREHHVHRAVAHGLVSVLPRQESDFERILRAVVAVREGKLEMPEAALGWLVQQIRSIQQDVLAPKGLTSSGLETREVDVLRLLADGMDTEEVALRLNYSERTVKNIIHGMLARLKLKNRAQAVAYALRNGAL
jgi:DNA-binding NarL/FixJ family response regulator